MTLLHAPCADFGDLAGAWRPVAHLALQHPIAVAGACIAAPVIVGAVCLMVAGPFACLWAGAQAFTGAVKASDWCKEFGLRPGLEV